MKASTLNHRAGQIDADDPACPSFGERARRQPLATGKIQDHGAVEWRHELEKAAHSCFMWATASRKQVVVPSSYLGPGRPRAERVHPTILSRGRKRPLA